VQSEALVEMEEMAAVARLREEMVALVALVAKLMAERFIALDLFW
jgi:hypothetical protein